VALSGVGVLPAVSLSPSKLIFSAVVGCAGREAPGEASLSAKACPKEDSQRIRLSS